MHASWISCQLYHGCFGSNRALYARARLRILLRLRNLATVMASGNCRTSPCPYCAIDLPHDTERADVLMWWRQRAESFVLGSPATEQQPFAFFIQACAVRSLLSAVAGAEHSADSAPPRARRDARDLSAAVERREKLSKTSLSWVTSAGTEDPEAQVLRSAVRERAEYWKYRGGKEGMGKWKWMDQETSRKLEDAYLANAASLNIDSGDGWTYHYDFRDMTQTSIPNDDTAPVTRDVTRVVNGIEA